LLSNAAVTEVREVVASIKAFTEVAVSSSVEAHIEAVKQAAATAMDAVHT